MDRKRDWFIPMVGLLLVFILAARSPLDTDMWWHLKAGELTISSGQPYLVDTLSLTRFGEGWINHSWLSEVGMAILYNAGGFLALGAATALLATASMAFVYYQSTGPAMVKAFLLILGSAVAAVVWSPRPQLVSMVLLAIVSTVLFLYKWKRRDHLVWLPVIFFLWGNLHGGYPLGLLLIGAIVAGEAATNLLAGKPGPSGLGWRQIGRLLLWSLISVLALLLNPNGLNIWKIPFQTVEVSALQQFIEEWASPDFHQLYQQPFLWLLFGILAAVGLARRRMDASDLVTVVVFGAMGLVARRNIGPFAVVGIPILSRYVWAAWQSRSSLAGVDHDSSLADYSPPPKVRPRWQRRLNLAIVGVLAMIAFVKLYAVTYPGWMDSAIRSSEPAAAVDWMISRGLQGRVLNEYNWGGYLEWRTQNLQVFVDGRTDLFGDIVLNEWLGTVQAAQGWETTLNQWRIDYLILDPARPLAQAAAQNGWKILYQDTQAVVYGK
jgi:hypothetical protein